MDKLVELEHRLNSLERRNRRLAAAATALCLIALASCAGLSAAQNVETVTASRLQIVDDENNVMLELGPDADGYALVIRDRDGNTRISLRHVSEETGLFIKDTAGDSRVGVAHFAHGGSGVALHGPEVRGAAVLYYKNSGSLSFYEPDGTVLRRLP